MSLVAEIYGNALEHMRAVNAARPNTFKATELAVFERVAAGERVPPDELAMATITVLAVSDAFIANGRWNAETAWTFRFGQPEGEPH